MANLESWAFYYFGLPSIADNGFVVDTTPTSDLNFYNYGNAPLSAEGFRVESFGSNNLSLFDGNSGDPPVAEFTVNYPLNATLDATAVPFEFQPSYGLLLLGGLWGANRLRKAMKTKKEGISV